MAMLYVGILGFIVLISKHSPTQQSIVREQQAQNTRQQKIAVNKELSSLWKKMIVDGGHMVWLKVTHSTDEMGVVFLVHNNIIYPATKSGTNSLYFPTLKAKGIYNVKTHKVTITKDGTYIYFTLDKHDRKLITDALKEM